MVGVVDYNMDVKSNNMVGVVDYKMKVKSNKMISVVDYTGNKMVGVMD